MFAINLEVPCCRWSKARAIMDDREVICFATHIMKSFPILKNIFLQSVWLLDDTHPIKKHDTISFMPSKSSWRRVIVGSLEIGSSHKIQRWILFKVVTGATVDGVSWAQLTLGPWGMVGVWVSLHSMFGYGKSVWKDNWLSRQETLHSVQLGF